MLQLKKQFEGVAIGLGVMYIIDGALAATVLLALLEPLTGLVVSILEAVFFFKAARKY